MEKIHYKRKDTLLDFAVQLRLTLIANTYFKKNKNRNWTWESPDGNNNLKKKQKQKQKKQKQKQNNNNNKTRQTIFGGTVKDCSVITGVDIGSDRRMVRTKVRITTNPGSITW